VQVQSLQLPGDDRRDLAARCESAVRGWSSQDDKNTVHTAGGHELVA
jgi:hypothetical protein